MKKFEENSLKSIKSSYIQKWVTSFLYEKQKLNLFLYNKRLQKKLDIDIETYKKISGKYKIGEKNGKGKEYLLDTYKLIFEGEYKNGRKNGKGKEYYVNGNLLFEGEYLNGKRWNGKGYNKDGEFEIKDGNGKIMEYYDDNIKYEGEYIKGERNVKRKEYQYNKLIYKGEYLCGEKKWKRRRIPPQW